MCTEKHYLVDCYLDNCLAFDISVCLLFDTAVTTILSCILDCIRPSGYVSKTLQLYFGLSDISYIFQIP